MVAAGSNNLARKSIENGHCLHGATSRVSRCVTAQLGLWSGKSDLTLSAKNVLYRFAIHWRPLDVTLRYGSQSEHVEKPYPSKIEDTCLNVCRRFISQLLVHPDFFKFVEEGVGLSQIVRISKLANEISRAY